MCFHGKQNTRQGLLRPGNGPRCAHDCWGENSDFTRCALAATMPWFHQERNAGYSTYMTSTEPMQKTRIDSFSAPSLSVLVRRVEHAGLRKSQICPPFPSSLFLSFFCPYLLPRILLRRTSLDSHSVRIPAGILPFVLSTGTLCPGSCPLLGRFAVLSNNTGEQPRSFGPVDGAVVDHAPWTWSALVTESGVLAEEPRCDLWEAR